MKILFTASEVVPFAKTGGLADVAGALPKALERLGHEVIVVMPRYYSINRDNLEHIPGPLGVSMGPMGELWAGVYSTTLPDSNVRVYFIDYEAFYGRSGLYTDENGFSYPDNDNRFIFLSKAAFQLCKKLDFQPDIIHSHDWHTAPQPLLRNTRYLNDEFFINSATVLTIHNLQHQGQFYKGAMDVMEVGWEHFNPYEIEVYDGVNFLKGGIAHCDALTTVSRKYAQEIQTPEFGFGLQEHIKAHSHKLRGILNGIDYDEWSPDKDKYIVKNYDINNLEGKKECKRDLQKIFDLPIDESKPVIGFVGRFAEQKGIGLIAQAMEGLLNLGTQIVMLGTGEKWAEGFFADIAHKYSDRFAVYVGYSNELAHKIEAGSDMFLMPSLFEPCGLNQIYSLRYGTLPIVRATGGLDDTIENYHPMSDKDRYRLYSDNRADNTICVIGTGFKFYEASADALYHTVKWAIDTWYEQKNDFRAMQINAMNKRFDWEKSAKEYIEVYEDAIARRRD